MRPPLLRHLCLLLGLALLPALAAAWLHPKLPDWGSLSESLPTLSLAEAVKREQKGRLLWVDARSQEAFAAGHIPGALSLNEEHWERGLEAFVTQWQPGVPVIVYCGSEDCHSSQQLARRIRAELGVEQVLVLRGGWQAWQKGQP